MISFAVLIRIGPYEFAKGFNTEREALQCFDEIAASQDGVIENGTLTQPSNAIVDRVTIRRYRDNIDRVTDPADPKAKEDRIGDPNRQ